MLQQRIGQWPALLGLSLIIVVAFGLRIGDLGARSITHPEMYVPGIHMPAGISEPHERLTLPQVITGTFSSDTHPPGYYVLMWGWTKLFGAGIWSIRLPAALLGTACVPLVFWLGLLVGQRPAGWIAAVLVGASGYQVFWSQVARMFSLTCFLGLLATIVLIHMARNPEPKKSAQISYALIILLGVSTHVFFWSLFFTHILWCWSNSRNPQHLPGLFRLQILVLILSSPFLAFSAYQSGTTLATLSANAFAFIRDFAGFAFLLPSSDSGSFRIAPFPAVQGLPASALHLVLFLASALLLIAGVRTMQQPTEKLLTSIRGPARRMWFAAAALSTTAIVLFVVIADRFNATDLHSTVRLTKILIVLPGLLAVSGIFTEARWQTVAVWSGRLCSRLFAGIPALVIMLAVLPFGLLAGISLLKPVLNQRGLMFVTPYLLLVLAAGIVAVSRRRATAAAIAVILATLHIASLRFYRHMTVDPADYQEFATLLKAKLATGDLIFLRRSWDVTPILYYLPENQFHLVGSRYDQACRRNPAARIWTVQLYELDNPAGMKQALSEYRPGMIIEAPHARAIAYQRASANGGS